jgi:CzcA family heavy metal efflux pump
MIITDFALNNRTSVLVLTVIIIVAGAVSYVVLPREAAPDIQIPYVWVTSSYEGVSPSDMETLVTLKIEKELKSLKDVKEIRSSSIEGSSFITIEFEPGVDIDDAMQKVREKVDRAKPELPQDMEDDPFITEINFSEMPILLININGGDDQVRLKFIADELEDAIEAIPGVLNVDVIGALEREIQIEFDPDRLAAYAIDPAEAILSLRQNNVNVPSGSLELGEAKFNVTVPGEFKDPDEINNIVVAMRNGRPIYLLDVAQVVDGFKERMTYSRLNGKPTVTLAVSKRSGENIIGIIQNVKGVLKAAEPMLPHGVSFSLTADQSEDIKMMLDDLENNFWSGLILIMVVIFLALGFRDAILVSMAIPFSMLISFAVLRAMGLTLNMVVLFSLTLSLGMLVDNAIVIIENIHRHHNLGLRRLEAAFVATREVAWPVTTSTLTTIAAFLPLLFWPGIMGEFMSYLPETVIVTLSASLFVALVMNPAAASLLMKKETDPEKGNFARSWFVRSYVVFLKAVLEHRWTTIFLACGLLVAMVKWFAMSGLGTELFPATEPRQATINIKLPEGSSLESSDRFVRMVEAAARRYSDCEDVVASAGGGLAGGFGSGGGAKTSESHVTIEFVDRRLRKMKSTEIIKGLREDLSSVSGAEISVEKQEEGPPTGAAISLEISGDDFETIGRLAGQARERLKAIEGIVDLKDNLIVAKPELKVKIDKEKAALVGLSVNRIGYTIRTAIQGAKAGVYRVGNDEYDVMVRLPKPERSEIDTLARFRIATATGAQVPLSTVADFEWTSGLASVQRVQERRTVTVTADVSPGFNKNAVLEQAKTAMAEMGIPAGYLYRFTGQNKEQEESQTFLSQAFVAAILLISLVIVLQFDSIILTLTILTSVILSLIGVFFGLVITGTSFGIIMTGIGVISLAGVVVNNAIILIDFMEKLRARGETLRDAVIHACSIRLRPVLLTAITTVLGLIPMATGISYDFKKFAWDLNSESSQWWGSMSICVIFGLTVATMLTLGVVPALYVILDPLRHALRHIDEKDKEKALEFEAALPQNTD